jgi:hypothetical protein
MRELGFTDVELTIKDYDDDTMIEIMTVENSTQRGHNTAALMDSVAAITRRLAYLMLSNEVDDLGTIVPRCFGSKKAAETARGQLLKGNGLGHSVILAFAPEDSLHEREVKTAIGTLKANGQLNQILADVQEQIAAEAAEAEAEAEAAPTPAKQEKAKAKRKSASDATQAATTAKSRNETTVDSKVSRLFSNANQLSAFTKVMAQNADIIPVESQEAIAEELVKDMGDDISGVAIKNWVNDKAHDIRVEQRANTRKEKKEAERKKAQNSLEGHIATIQRGVNLIMSAVANANALMQKNNDLSPPRGAQQLKRGIRTLINELEKLEGVL